MNTRSSSGVRRQLFAEEIHAHDQDQDYMVSEAADKDEHEQFLDQKQSQWNFDFRNGRPLPGPYEWTPVARGQPTEGVLRTTTVAGTSTAISATSVVQIEANTNPTRRLSRNWRSIPYDLRSRSREMQSNETRHSPVDRFRNGRRSNSINSTTSSERLEEIPGGYDTGSSPAVLGSSSPPTIVTDRGKPTRLKCIYTAQPEAKIHWLRDGKEVRHDCDTCISAVKHEMNPKASYLDITPYEEKDFGEYECRIRNKYGSAKLKILLKKSDVQLTKCEQERITANDPRRRYEFRPVCNDDGSYHEVQCSIELTTCWCVNKHGKKTLDVIAGVNGLHCFKPKDLSVVAILVLIHGIVLTMLMVDQAFYIYAGYSLSSIAKKHYETYRHSRNKGYKQLKREDRKCMKMRPLPSIPVDKHRKSRRR